MTKLRGLIIVFLISSSVYLFTQVSTVYGGDAGDFLAAITTQGIPHPPGYPLYTSLGILINQFFPFGTPAYKTAFLSVIPSVLTLLILFLFLYKISGRLLYSLITVFILGFSYTYWLYSTVVEVFSLNNFFLISIIYSSFLYQKSGRIKYLYLLNFLFGLSLSHHHIILFILPAVIAVIYKRFKTIKFYLLVLSIFYFLSGLTPYIYTLISSTKSPALNWMGEANILNLINLFLRTTYGTFTAGSFINQNILSRFLNIFGFMEFWYRDFTAVSLILLISGIYLLSKEYKNIFRYFIWAFLPYLFFFFYASFPLYDNFLVATLERFILPLNLILTIPFVFGFVIWERILNKLYHKYFSNLDIKFLTGVTKILFAVIPILLLIKNFPKIGVLKSDFTAENFAYDILNSVEADSILILSSDTPLFDTQYVYYNMEKWPNLKLIHFSKLSLPYYIKQLKKDYPEIKSAMTFNEKYGFEDFLSDNSKFNIYSKQSFQLEKGHFVPWGLVYKYIPEKSMEKKTEIIDKNEALWQEFQNPLSGNTTRYNNLFLSDVLKSYLIAHQEIAQYEARENQLQKSLYHLNQAKLINIKDEDTYIILTQVYIKEKDCLQAFEEINKLKKISPENNTVNLLKYLNYDLCLNDKKRAADELSTYRKNEEKKETPLKTL